MAQVLNWTEQTHIDFLLTARTDGPFVRFRTRASLTTS